MIDARTVEAAGEIFTTLHIVEIAVILILIGGIVFLIKNFNKLVDARVEKQKKENKQFEIENNALLVSMGETAKRLEETFRQDREERLDRQCVVDEKLSAIEKEIKNLYAITANNGALASKASQGALENMVFNEGLAVSRRLKAFRRLIAKRGNGRAKAKGMELILENKEIWKDVQDTELDVEIIDQKYYDDVLKEINDRIFS